MATLEEIMAALNAGGSASNMSSSDLATLMSGGGAMSSGSSSDTAYGGANGWTDPNSPEFKSRMDTLTNTMLSGQRNQVEDYVRRAALSGVQRGGYNVAGAPNYAGGLQREAINALAGGYDTRYTNALNYLMNAGTLNEKGIERSFTAEQNSKQQAATAALQAAGFDQQTAERIAAQQFSSGEAATQRGWQSGENVLGREFTAGESEKQRGWQSGENTAQRGWQTGERLGTQGWQAWQATNQQNWQADQNRLNLAQQKAIADQNYQIALTNAQTQKDRDAANQIYQQDMMQLEKDKFQLQKDELNKPLPPTGSPPSGGTGTGSPPGGGGKSGGSGGGGSGPPGLGPSANIPTKLELMPQLDLTRPSLTGQGEGRGSGEYVPIVWGGEAGWSEQDAYEKMLQDMGMLGDAQAGADSGSFAPTPEEYQNSWTGSTDYGNRDYNYEVPGNSIDPWQTSNNSGDSWDSYW